MTPKKKGTRSRPSVWWWVLAVAIVGGGWWMLSTDRKSAASAIAASEISSGNATPPSAAVRTAAVAFQPARPAALPPVIAEYRARILTGRFGVMPVEELLKALANTPGGPSLQLIYQALALRKQEALPYVRERLRTGEPWEKHMLTKFLLLCPWPETKPELLALAASSTDNWVARQGALFALGAQSEQAAGPVARDLLLSPTTNVNLQLAAISTLARTGYTEGIAAIAEFQNNANIHVRLFAMQAMALLEQPVDKAYLLSALSNPDYVVRQEATEVLWHLEGVEVADALAVAARDDVNEAVRSAATQALLQRQLVGRTAAEKTEILRAALEGSDRFTALWIFRTALSDGGAAGRALVESNSTRKDAYGERAQAYLIYADSRT